MNPFPGTWVAQFTDNMTRDPGDNALGANWTIVDGTFFVDTGVVSGTTQDGVRHIAYIPTSVYTFPADQGIEAVVSPVTLFGLNRFYLLLSYTPGKYYYARLVRYSDTQYNGSIGYVGKTITYGWFTELPIYINNPNTPIRLRFSKVNNTLLLENLDTGVVIAGAGDGDDYVLPVGQPGIAYEYQDAGEPIPYLDGVVASTYVADDIPTGGGGGGTGIYPTVEVMHPTQIGCNLGGSPSRTGASYIAVFVKYAVPTAATTLFVSSGATPLTIYCNSDGSMQIDANGTTLAASSAVGDLEFGAQFGVLYWNNGVHNFQYVVNGQVRNTVTYNGTLGVNVFRSGYAENITPQYPVNFDEFLFWQAGNFLTDDDLYDIYKSYYASPGFQSTEFYEGFMSTGFYRTEFSCGNFNQPVYVEILSCLTADSLCHKLDFVAARPCLFFERPVTCLTFDSKYESPFNSKHHCVTHSTGA